MALEVKPQEGYSLVILKYQQTGKKRKKEERKKVMKRDWSRQFYVHLHIKKRAVSGVGGKGGGGVSDEPCILNLQASHKGSP